MKLSVMQENLARGLSVVSRAVSSRSTLPVLANVLLKTEDAGLKLTATNLEIGITYWVPGKIDEDGATTVPAKLLTDLVNSLPSGDKVDLEVAAGDTLHVRAVASRPTSRASMPRSSRPSRRPAIDRPPGSPRTSFDERSPRRPSPPQVDEARPILTGVLAKFEGDRLTLAAADNYRIAVKTIPILDPVPETSVVIPARALNELARVLADIDDPVDVVLAAGRNQVLFHLDGVDLVSRLIDGQFPNYQQVMPQTHATRAVLDREELLRAVRPAALIAHESANIVKLQIGGDAEPGITVSANAEVGDHVGQVEAAVEGDGTTIAFNAPVPGGRPDQRDGRAVRARVERPPLTRRLQADR